jgi:hypothetical protein
MNFAALAGWFQGRHTLFVVASFLVGGVMSWFHRLDANYVTLILGLQGMVLAHSIKDDHYANGAGDGK